MFHCGVFVKRKKFACSRIRSPPVNFFAPSCGRVTMICCSDRFSPIWILNVMQFQSKLNKCNEFFSFDEKCCGSYLRLSPFWRLDSGVSWLGERCRFDVASIPTSHTKKKNYNFFKHHFSLQTSADIYDKNAF